MGSGSEASVFDLGNGTVLRLHKSGAKIYDQLERVTLLSKLLLIEAEHSFQIPRVIDQGIIFDRLFTLEDRLEGQTMSEALSAYSGYQRKSLIESYMETATQFGTLYTPKESIFGEVAKSGGVCSETFRGFLYDRALVIIRENEFDIDVADLVSPFVEPETPELMHLDYYPANVLCHDGKVTAVLDFGSTSVMGCGSFNPAIALAFLDPKITPSADNLDCNRALDWLLQRSSKAYFTAVKDWLAVYWSFCDAKDDPVLFRWCRETLKI